MFNAGCFGLYHDDGLVFIDRASARTLDSIRKKTISHQQGRTDFLDVTLDLSSNTYKLSQKLDANISYMN